MVKDAVKKSVLRATRRRKSVQHGEVRRDTSGNVTMIEINEYTPNPLAPTFIVNKIGGIYRVSAHLLKVTFILATPTFAGQATATERVNLVWENSDMEAANEQFGWVFDEFRKGTFISTPIDDGGGRRGRTQ